ncbi:MAG: hypothetical protein IKQ61_11040 [Spirochaetales bacterium]|nr:hypothetical protein [Spirochaetales bacterium]
MVYIIIVAVLAVLFGLRAVSCFILREDRSQIMMCLVYVIYVLFTINHRFMGGSVHSDSIFNLLSYFLLTATYILVGEYVCSIYHNKAYRYISIGLYTVLVILMINQYVLCALNINGLLFLIGMCEMSVIFVVNAAVFLIKDFKKLSTDTRLLIATTDFMVLCLVMILIFNLMDMRRDVYWFAFGILLYILTAEYVSVKRIRQRLSDFNDIDKQMKSGHVMAESEYKEEWKGTLKTVFDLMAEDENRTAKNIAFITNLSVNTVKSYMSQIYSHFGVHSREEFHKKISNYRQSDEPAH